MDNKVTKFDATVDEKFEERSVTSVERDNTTNVKIGSEKMGKITSYKYQILVRDKAPIEGELSREEMNKIYMMYSSEGSNLTQRTVSREFPQYTFQEFKKILRAFNISKASAPLAPHIIEEKGTEDLVALTYQQKESNYLKKVEQDKNKYTEKQLKDLIKDHSDLKEAYSNLGETILKDVHIVPYTRENNVIIESEKDLILHLSDLHIGAKTRSTSLYQNEYNYDIVKLRLTALLKKIESKKFDNIIVNLLGDMLDGMDQQTARRDHIMPQNMDNMEQVTAFLEIMEWFFASLYKLNISNNIKVYSVINGNHDGITAYVSTLALFNKLNLVIPQCETQLFTEFFGYYEFKGHQFVICHGKDSEFMKVGMPLNLDLKNKDIMRDWLESKEIYGKNIHFIKGDLHSDNLNTSYKLDYRNCLSLFGSSDYANFNFSKNDYGVSYEVIDNGDLLRGSFINL